MASFTSSHAETRALPVSPAQAAERFAEPARQASCHPELAEATVLDAARVRMAMKEMSHGPVKFSGRYTLSFARDGNDVTWASSDGNLHVLGRAHFHPAPGGCTMDFREEVRLELELNRVLAGVIRPVAEAMMKKGMRGFVERMSASIASA
ncbi:MAG: SRPBCC family protein [Deltaproteobacteria bacterium]|nr:SRPBCC family protein [Deltaproteobacteria bacterium]